MNAKNIIFFFGLIFGAVIVINASRADILPDHKQFILPNGLEVILIENHEQPMVSTCLLLKTGSAADSENLSGLALLTTRMLKEGTTKFPSSSLAATVDSVGGELGLSPSYKDGFLISGDFLSRDCRLGLTILSQMATRPTFEKETLARLKKRQISALMQIRSIPSYQLMEKLDSVAYGNSGYGLAHYGKMASIKAITPDDIQKFYRQYIRPDNAVLTVAGDIKTDIVQKEIRELFGGWQGKAIPPPSRTILSSCDSTKIILLNNPDAASTDFIIGLPAVPAGADDFPALVLLNYILGEGGKVSRLDQVLIENNNLATTITSKLVWSKGNGMIQIVGSAPNETAAEAIKSILTVLDDLTKSRIPVRELDEAKYYFRGFFPGLFETIYGTTNQISRLLSYDLKIDYLDKLLDNFKTIDPAKMKKAAETYLDSRHMIIIVSGPESALKRGLIELGPLKVDNGGQN
jgi:zinc protease